MNIRTHQSTGTLNPFAVPRQFSDASVSAWAESLPLANREFSVRALLAIIRELNRKEHIPCGERFVILERLRPTAEMLNQQCVDTHLTDAAFPLSQSAQRVANRCFLLALETAHGYRRIAMHRDFSLDATMDDRVRAVVIYRSLQAYGQALLRVTECYQPSPQNFWRSIYELYQLGEAHGLLSTPLSNLAPEEGERTIGDIFTAIALFSLACANRHRPREVRQLYALINYFSNFAEMRRTAVSSDQSAQFVIDLRSDRGPYRIAASSGEVTDAFRFLYTRGFINHLLERSTGGATGRQGVSFGLSAGVIKRLVRALGATPERRKSNRLDERGERVVIIGLKHMIELLWRGRPVAPLSPESAAVQYKGVKWLSVPDLSLEHLPADRIGSVQRGNRNEIAIGAMMSERKRILSREEIWGDQRIAGPDGGVDISQGSVETINASARGYCLLWTNKIAACLRVGELLGFPTQTGVLHIGVVRWLNQIIDGGLMLGVEMLAPRTQAVRLSVGGRSTAMQMALFVPADKRLSHNAAILVQPAHFDVGEALTVEAAGVSHSYRIERLLESSPSFQHFALVEDTEVPVTLS
ncbi:MAG: hypothetical protein H6R26_24 [Proteobacteria bacterium]|nr:hypothetical protein [Pseudomonadota bacterium]